MFYIYSFEILIALETLSDELKNKEYSISFKLDLKLF